MTGFDDLNEAGKEQQEEPEQAQERDDEAEEATSTPPVDESSETLAGELAEASTSTEMDRTEPAFPFDDAVQAQIYPRKSTHDEFTDFLDIEVKRRLRERDIRNEEGRELHEAVLQVAMEHPEEIAKEVEEQRTGRDS